MRTAPPPPAPGAGDDRAAGDDVRRESLYLARVRALPTTTQQVLLVAAADTAARLATVEAAAARAGLGADDLDAAQLAGLVDVDAAVTFRHPLVRSAVYRGAAPADRRHAHALLAAVTDPQVEPDAWVWHRAKSVSGTDEDVAAALEARGHEVERRGRYAAYAALMSRAAELTPDPVELARRTQAAATALLVAGAQREAGTVLERVRIEHAEPLVRAQAQRLRAVLTFIGRPVDALATLVDAARSLEDLDPQLARVTYVEGLFLAAVTGRFAPPGLTEQLVESALAALDPGESSLLADLVRGLAARLTGDFTAAAPAMRRSVAWLSQHDAPPTFTLSSHVASVLAMEVYDIEAYRPITDKNAAEQRSRGALDLLRASLQGQAHHEFLDGRFDRAAALYDEATEISRSIGDHRVAYSMILLQQLGVWRDDEATSRANIAQVHALAVTEVRSGFWERMARESLVILENSLGNYAAALEAGWPLVEQDPVLAGHVLVEIVEAAHRSGRDDLAAAALDRLAVRARASRTLWADGLHARGVAIVAGDDAEAHFQRALATLGQVPVRTDLARTHLLYGEWLRRQNRRRDARVQLGTAHDLFTTMGAPHFSRRAARELAATGAVVRRRPAASTSEPLTPQEKAIAHLAAGPATHREIAASLFLSASTVDYHLRKVYRKLGVDSRRRLADALGEP
ncbi:LuxR family transcriptional regulator [Cellulomonas phragmiteti]|nr:LuxR family transcriptional regulator [Cellulomonas phragmiteti]